MNKNLTHHKHLLTASQSRLFNRLKRKRTSISKLTNAELIDSIYLNDCGLVKFDRTRKGNVSRFLVVKEDV